MYLGPDTIIKHTPPGDGWERATIDHVIPLAHGGSHTLENFVLACLRCNSSKGTRALATYLDSHGQQPQE
jgi:5-methylcytosine-specific restriction endonuclease McrA